MIILSKHWINYNTKLFFNHLMLSFMISCKKSNLLSNSFVFSLIALNAKTINSFDEKNENERVDERTKERKNAYELKKKANVMMKRETYEMMMMIKEKRNQANKRKKSKKKSKNEWKKKKKNALIAIRSWWCDVLKTKCVFSSSKIYEECSSCLVSIRRCSRSFLSTSLRDLRFDIANVAEKTSIRTMKKEEKIIVDDWWKKLKKQKSWSRSNERWWKRAFWKSWEKTSWKSWRKSWRRSWKRFWKREFYEYKTR